MLQQVLINNVMRTNFFLLIILSISLSACSVETVMELEDNLNVILLETVDLPEKHVGDTMVFKVFAGTNDVLTRMSVTNATHDFSSMILGDGIYFEIVEDTLYTDAAGYFNRPVSSVVVNYPILIGRELLSQIAGVLISKTAYNIKRITAAIKRLFVMPAISVGTKFLFSK